MAETVIKATYSLDVESVHTLEELARRWRVSKSEVLRRAIRGAASDDNPALVALERLQASVRERNVTANTQHFLRFVDYGLTIA